MNEVKEAGWLSAVITRGFLKKLKPVWKSLKYSVKRECPHHYFVKCAKKNNNLHREILNEVKKLVEMPLCKFLSP